MSNGNEQNNTRNPVPALKELFVLALGPLFRYSLGMAGHPDKACRSPAGSSIRVPTASSLKLETRLRSTPWPVFRLLMRAILGAILTISIVSFIGCTRPSFRWETHTWSAPSSSNFDAHVLTEEPVAIAPTMTPSIVSGYRSVLSLILQRVVKESWPEVKATGHHETLTKINQMGLAEEYTGIARDWHQSGILDRERLNRIGSALGVKYVLLPGWVGGDSSFEDRFVISGLRTVQTRTVWLRLLIQIWDVESGEIVYESFGGGIGGREVVEAREGIKVALARKVWWSMIEDLKNGKTVSYYRGVENIEERPEPITSESTPP